MVGDLTGFEPLAAPGPRSALVERRTRETEIRCAVDLDGVGRTAISAPIGFLGHMLDAFGRHAHVDLHIAIAGDLHIDGHHTVEDTGLVLGEALRQALGDRRGIWRTGHAVFPMDESRARAAVDLGGRPYLQLEATFERSHVGELATDLVPEFFAALTNALAANVHLAVEQGVNDHHKIEALFKAFARAFEHAAARHPRAGQEIPSTKGALDGVAAVTGAGGAAPARPAADARGPRAAPSPQGPAAVAPAAGGFAADDLGEPR